MALTTVKQLLSTLLLLSLSNELCALTFTTEGCGETKGCFVSPASCSTSENCDFLVTYNATNSTHIEFELSGKGDWMAVGFSDDQLMANTDILMCVNNRALSGHYYATGRSRPPRTNPTPAAVQIIEQEDENNIIKCRISREVNPVPGVANFTDLNQEVFLLAAYGPVTGATIETHTDRRASTSKIDVRAGGTATEDNALPAEVLAHGIMMTLAWVLFAFVGLFTARYMREVWEPRKLLGEKAWFTVHRTLMTITLLLTIAATIVIFEYRREWSSGVGPHPYLGIVAIAFAIAQPIMAAFRPHPGAPRRNIFNWSHRIVGTIALVMAVVSIYYGLDTPKVDLGKQGLWAVISFYIGEFLIFMFELYLILSKRNKEKNSVSMGNTRDIPMEAPGHQTQPQTEMSMKEAMIRSFMFVFVTLLGASVALTIILLLVLK
ncbi:DOMON domain-containing protein frrs1L [Porites harrisoni]